MSERWPDKIIIGLTGNIATGKSAVMQFAAEKGAFTIDADKVVHEVLRNNAELQAKIVKEFGDRIKTAEGQIDRAALGKIVFRDPDALKKLEGMVQPNVREQIRQKIDANQAKIVMIEAIKLLEGPLNEEVDAVWVTTCGKLLQMQRLVYARGLDEETAFMRVAAQNPQAAKLAKADVIIDTTGTLEKTREQVAMAWDELTEGATAEPAAAAQPEPEASEPEAPEAKEEETISADAEVVVRRARPSDIPSIMLLIHKATDGKVKPKRAEILMALSERGYLIGQADGVISSVVGWYADQGFAGIEQCYIHPPAAAEVTGKPTLEEVGKTANELMCEAVFAFLTEETPSLDKELLASIEYQTDEDRDKWPRVWKEAIDNMQPEGSEVMVKKLWNARVA